MLFAKADDHVGRFAHGEDVIDGEALGAKLGGPLFQIRAVPAHLLAFRELQAVVVPRDPAVRDVHEQESGAVKLRERPDVVEDRLIGGTVFERNQDGVIHGGIRSICR